MINKITAIIVIFISIFIMSNTVANATDVEELMKQGDIYNQKQHYDEAVKAYSEAIKLDTNEIWAYFKRGQVYARQENYDMAIQDYSKVLELDTNEISAYFERGQVYARQENYDMAIQDYSKVLDLKDKGSLSLRNMSYLNRASLYEKKQNYDMAIRDYSKFLELYPGGDIDGHVYGERARVYRKIGSSDLADADDKIFHTLRENEDKHRKDLGFTDYDLFLEIGCHPILTVGVVLIMALIVLGRLIYKFIKKNAN